MSYVVLARKWRPETFADVVGQKHVVLTLTAAIRSGRIAHAYLFAGPRGVGKTTVARLLAKSLNCEKGPIDEPCRECDSCREIASGKSLDVIEIDGASNRKIEDARGIRETVQYAPLSGRMKVYIIDEAHMLTREAFNALLKTLEEPPPHVVFIMATTEPGKIPETIASRCQLFDFHRISQPDMERRLREIASSESIDVDEGALKLVAARADGSMRDAESLLDQLMSVGSGHITPDRVAEVLGIPDADVFFSVSDAIAAGDAGGTLGALAAALDSGFDPRDLIDGMVDHLRNLLLVRAAPSPERLVGRVQEYAAHEGRSSELDEDDLLRLVRIGVDAQAAVRWTTQPGLIVEVALVRMAKLDRTVVLEDAVRAISGGGRAGGPSGARKKTRRTVVGEPDAKPPGGARESARPSSAGNAVSRGRKATVASEVAARDSSSERAPAADGGGQDDWLRAVAAIRAVKPGLAASLQETVASPASGGRVLLTVPNGSPFHQQQLRDRANMAIMERAASEAFGGAVRLDLEFTERSRKTATPPGANATNGAGELEDPMIRKVVEMFDGEITETRREE